MGPESNEKLIYKRSSESHDLDQAERQLVDKKEEMKKPETRPRPRKFQNAHENAPAYAIGEAKAPK
ncbi:hypothetical protein LTR56_003846 [Elasticomyces elasticus]|nr:hypothetical protein LTR56_003846 [Elasticomyces elasticus]KAK5740319.1 hypothetical protein LTS12_024995 [Elasticomyces elasticus]